MELTLRKGALLAAGCVVVLVVVAIMLTAARWREARADTALRNSLMADAQAIASPMNPAMVAAISFTTDDLGTPAYERITDQLRRYIRFSGHRGVWTCTERDGAYYFGPESYAEGDPIHTPPGTLYQLPPTDLPRVFATRESCDTGPFTDEFGTFISALVPVLDPRTGEVLMVLGLDTEAHLWRAELARAYALPIVIGLSILLTLLLGAFAIIRREALPDEHRAALRHLETLVVGVVCLLLTIALTQTAFDVERRDREHLFERAAFSRAQGVRDEFYHIAENVRSLARYFENSDHINREEFQRFVAPFVTRSAVRAFAWAPAIARPEQAAFIEMARQEGYDGYTIRELSDHAAEDAALYPLLHIAPESENAGVHGANLFSEPARRAAIMAAMASGLTTATEPVLLLTPGAADRGLLVFHPVYSGEHTPLGVAVVAIDLQRALETALERTLYEKTYLDTSLVKLSLDADPEILADYPPGHSIEQECMKNGNVCASYLYHQSAPIFAFDRCLAVVSHPNPPFLAANAPRMGWLALVSGGLLTLLATLFTAFMRNRQKALEETVGERTRALRNREEHLAVTLQSIGDGVIVTDVEGNVVRMNPMAERLTGWCQEEAGGLPFDRVFVILHAETGATVDSPVRTALATEGIVGLANNTTLVSRDGAKFQIADSAAPIRHEDGRIAGVVVVFSDVTEGYLARRRIEENEARLRAITESGNDAIIVMGARGEITFWNPAAQAMFGYAPEAALGQDLHTLIVPERYRAAHHAAYPEFQRSGGGAAVGQTLELEALRKDGGEISVELSLSALRINNEWHAVGILRDISSRKEMERRIQHATERFNRLAEQSREIIWEVDTEGVYTYISPVVTDVLGYLPGDIIGKMHFYDFHPEEGRDAFREAAFDVFSRQGTFHDVVNPLQTRDGDTIWVSTSGLPLVDDTGALLGYQGSDCDITERRQLEESLRQYTASLETERENLQRMFEASPIGFLLIDKNMRVQQVNDVAARLVGRDSADMLGLFPGDGLCCIHAALAPAGCGSGKECSDCPVRLGLKYSLFEGKKIVGWEVERTLLIKGEPLSFWFSISAIPVQIDNAPHTLMAISDITQRKKSEISLTRVNECLTRMSVDYQTNVDRITALTGGLFQGASAFYNKMDNDTLCVVGRWQTPEDLEERFDAKGHICTALIKGESDILVVPDLNQSEFASTDPAVDLYGLRAYFGHAVHCQGKHAGSLCVVFTAPFEPSDEDKRLLGILASALSAEENRHVATEALKRSEVRLSLATRGAGIGIWDYDVVNDHLEWDALMFELFDVKPDAFGHTLKDWSDCVLPEELPQALEDFQAAIQGNKDFSIEFRIRLSNGAVRYLAGSGTVSHNEEGRPMRVVGVNYDITARKEAEKQMLKAQKELLQSNEELENVAARANQMAMAAEAANIAKSQFLANMSHEIRTPMNGVIGMTDLLMGTTLNDEQRQYAEVARSSGEALLALINDILDFSKIEADKLELESIDFDVRATLEGAAELLAVRASEKDIELVNRIEPDVCAFVQGDPGRLRQVLINLGNNAIKFTHTGEVVLHTFTQSETAEETVLRFEVQDTGIGIPEDKLPMLFSAFQQVDASTTRKYGGTGLGLAISKRLVELMDGDIGVESVEGRGSLFWFTARLKKRSPQAEPAAPRPRGDLRAFRVLGVDDNATNRQVLRENLSAWECPHKVVDCAAEALEEMERAVAAGAPYHALITDFQMPEMDGEDLGRCVRERPHLKNTIMVMMTSLGRRGDAKRFEAMGFAAYLTKPIKQSQFQECLLMLAEGGSRTAPDHEPGLITRHRISEAQRNRARILLAEDNLVNQKVALGMLRNLGYSADTVNNGLEAIQALEASAYSLVFMDVQMPEVDGLEATRRIRSGETRVPNPNIPIVAMTANAMQGDRDMCIAAGMNDYIAKPVQINAIREKLEQWLRADASDEPIQEGTPTNAGVPDRAVFDRALLVERLMDDEDLVQEIIEVFLDDIPKQIENLHTAMEQDDIKEVAGLAHKIKGAAGNIGAAIVNTTAAEMEAAGLAGDMPRVHELLPELERRFEQLRMAMNPAEERNA